MIEWKPIAVALLCVAFVCGCGRPDDARAVATPMPQWSYAHVRFEFEQSPLAGTTDIRSALSTVVPQVLDLSVPMYWDEAPVATYRGEFRIYHTLRDDAKVLIFGNCKYDPLAEAIVLDPVFAYLRAPDLVYANTPPLGGEPRKAWVVNLSPRCPIVLSGVRETEEMTGPSTDRRNFGINLAQRPRGQEEYRWGVSVQVYSYGLLPNYQHPQHTPDGKEIRNGPQLGMTSWMFE